jgi:hypothetical protein
MKYVKNYKLFESASDDINHYLDVLETDKEEIKYILIDLIDLGYTISYDISFVGADGKSRIDKRSNENTPKLAINLKAPSDINVQRSKYTDTKLLGYLTRITNHVINTFSDKCEVYYLFGGGSWDITYVFKFPVEKDDTKLKFDTKDLREVLNQSLVSDDFILFDDYTIETSDSFNDNELFKIKIDLNSRDSKATELFSSIIDDEKNNVKRNYSDNEEESFDLIKKILIKFIDNLDKKYNMKFGFESLGSNTLHDNKDLSSHNVRNGRIYYLSKDEKVEFLKLNYNSNFKEYKRSVKSGLFKRRDIRIGLEDKMEIGFKLA